MTKQAVSNEFLARLRRSEPTLMLGVRSARTTEIVRLAKTTGYHALLLDLEHSAMPLSIAVDLCGACQDLGLTPIVRVPERDYGIIGRLLDGGATGIMAPRVETVEEARTLAAACRFPPNGQRSQIGMVPQLGMKPTPARDLNPLLDHASLVLVMLETPGGIANADAIAALPGVDLVSIGSNDLCAELGVPGKFDDPRFKDCVATVISACRRHGKLATVGGINDPAMKQGISAAGAAPLLLTGFDTEILFSAIQQRAERMLDTFMAPAQ